MQVTSFPLMYLMICGPAATHTESPSMARDDIGSGALGPAQPVLDVLLNDVKFDTHSPTKSKPIFPPSHKAHARPRQVRRCIRGPSVAPLCDRTCRTNGT